MRTVAEAIWSAAISAVLPERLVARRVSLDDLSLAAVDRIAVVGAGKAAGGMSAGIAELLGAEERAHFGQVLFLKSRPSCFIHG